jgi:hypothetical protein
MGRGTNGSPYDPLPFPLGEPYMQLVSMGTNGSPYDPLPFDLAVSLKLDS